MEFSLENFGLDSVHNPGLGPSPCFSSEGTNTQRLLSVTHSGSQTGSQGQTWTRRSHHHTQGVSVLVSCPSQNPAHPGTQSIHPGTATPGVFTPSVGCCAGLPPQQFPFQSWMRPAGPRAASEDPWASVLAGKHSLSLSQHFSANTPPQIPVSL